MLTKQHPPKARSHNNAKHAKTRHNRKTKRTTTQNILGTSSNALIHTNAKRFNTTTPTKNKITTDEPLVYNTQLPNTTIGKDGHLIFESRLRNTYKLISAGMAMSAGLIPALSLGTLAIFPPTSALLAVCGSAAITSAFISKKIYQFSQQQVETVRLLPQNTLQFETCGVFGFRRTVKYPANYVFPLTADPMTGTFGQSIDFLPLPQDMAQKPGQVHRTPSGLVIIPSSNLLTGAAKQAFDTLCSGDVPFEEVEKSTNLYKRKVAVFGV